MIIMDKLLERITKYDILVNCTPGCAIVLASRLIFNIDLLTNTILVDIFAIYFYGILAELLGTMFVLLLQKLDFITYAPYSKIISNSSNYKINIILRKVAMYKSLMGAIIILIFVWINRKNTCNIFLNDSIIFVYSTIIIFLLGCGINHQIDYLNKRINNNQKKKKTKKKS